MKDDPEREVRLAAALRANLSRRKARVREGLSAAEAKPSAEAPDDRPTAIEP